MITTKEITIKNLLVLDEEQNVLREYFYSSKFENWWIAKDSKDGKYGLISEIGVELTDFIYDDYKVNDFYSCIDGFGFVNYDYIIDAFLIRIDENGEKFYTIFTGSSKKVSDDEFSEVNFIINDNYDELLSCAIVKKGDRYGIIHGSGRFIIPLEYLDIKYKYNEDEVILTDLTGTDFRIILQDLYNYLIK